MIDFDAFNLYFELIEQLKILVGERDLLLKGLTEIAMIAYLSTSEFIFDSDIANVQEVLTKLMSLSVAIQAIVKEINTVAEKVGRPSIELRLIQVQNYLRDKSSAKPDNPDDVSD